MVKQKWSRSSNDGKAWRCKCGNVNQPTKHRFFNLPAFKCSQCQTELKLNFKFCLGEVEANGKSLIGEVWDQGKHPYCVAFAYGKLAHMMERVHNIKNGLDPDTVEAINPYDLEQRFNEKFRSDEKFPEILNSEPKVGAHKVLHMGLILRSEGIQRGEADGRYIATDVSTIPRDDFEQICRYLAEGTPLLATYWAGKRRGRLGYCKIYKSPHEYLYGPKGAAHIGHAVVLIGAGMKNGKKFFYFLNSWGEKFCPRKNKRGETIRGGIGKIQEGDLTKNVVMLSHPNETGGERSLEDQIDMPMSNRNYLLMKAKTNQWSARKLQPRQETNLLILHLHADKGVYNSIRLNYLFAVSSHDDSILSDDDSIYSDDEGWFSQTTCAFHQNHEATSGSLLRFRAQWVYQRIARAVRSLNNRPAAIPMPTDQSCTTNGRLLMNRLRVANESPQVNQTPVATIVTTPVASLVSTKSAANGRHLTSQPPTSNVNSLINLTSIANGCSLMTQVPAANGKSLISQIRGQNGRPLMSQRLAANRRSHKSQIHVASVHPRTNKVPGLEVHLAPMSCPEKVADPKLKEEGKMKVLPRKLTDSRKGTQTFVTKEPSRGLLQRGTSLLKEWRLRSTNVPLGWNETDV